MLEKTHLAVAKADKFLDSLSVKPAAVFDHGDMPQSELNELLLQLRKKLGKKQILRTDRRLQQIASRKDCAP